MPWDREFDPPIQGFKTLRDAAKALSHGKPATTQPPRRKAAKKYRIVK